MEKYSGFSIQKLADPSNTYSEPSQPSDGIDFLAKDRTPNPNNIGKTLREGGFEPSGSDGTFSFKDRTTRDRAYHYLTKSGIVGSFKKKGDSEIVTGERETPKGWEGAEIGNEESPDGYHAEPSNVSWGDQEGVRDNLDKTSAVSEFPPSFGPIELRKGKTTFSCYLSKADEAAGKFKDVSTQSYEAQNVVPYRLKVQVNGKFYTPGPGYFVFVTRVGPNTYRFRHNAAVGKGSYDAGTRTRSFDNVEGVIKDILPKLAEKMVRF